ncbi:MAG: hypothetical protein IBX50_19450 [Marinospirillum sp.]|uniref:hypothetical protein n=1 Tax=Marinospirillum sp. TaxID=2183934 RepID=UPI0019F3F3EA|nr:hypothetical protein [Marinospirillum sp.]MBE0508866.1 hypothetical protein [Marinospirillum sp.]
MAIDTRPPRARGLKPTSLLFELLAASSVLRADLLNGMAMQFQLFVSALGVLLKIVGRQKHTTLLDRTVTEFVDLVPDKVDRSCHLIQQWQVLVSNTNL